MCTNNTVKGNVIAIDMLLLIMFYIHNIKVILLVKECDDGTYGYECLNTCSGNCLDGALCDKEAGNCSIGCNPGYMYDNCSKGKIRKFD